MEKYILNTLSLKTHFIFSYLNKYIVIVVFSSIDENSKQGQDGVLHKEQTLRPHHHKRHHRQYHATHPHHPEVHLAPPVPLWNNKKFTLLHDSINVNMTDDCKREKFLLHNSIIIDKLLLIYNSKLYQDTFICK